MAVRIRISAPTALCRLYGGVPAKVMRTWSNFSGSAGADVNERYRRWTPFAAAVRQGHTEIATLLRSLGAVN